MSDLHRYHRQMLLPGFDEAAQRRLRGATALLVGCGALGTVIADQLVRAGVGRLRIVDRDLVELTNLQRQVLFTERDAAEATPKAAAAAKRLAAVNAEVAIEPVVADFTHRNAASLAEGADVLIDGTDNFETRLLINDLAVSQALPYVYGGAVGVTGTVYAVLPRASAEGPAPPWVEAGLAGPCLRCLLGDEADTRQLGSCDTVGVLGAAPGIVASVQAAEALKILTGNWAAVSRQLLSFDLMANRFGQMDVSMVGAGGECVCCGERRFDYLEGRRAARAAALCGRDAVQLQPGSTRRGGNGDGHGSGGADRGGLPLERVAEQLAAHGSASVTHQVLRATLEDAGRTYRLTLFPDGRAIVHGTEDVSVARALYSRYVGW